MRLPRLLGGRRRGQFLQLLAIGIGQAGVAIATALLIELAFERMISGTATAPGRTVALVGGGLAAVALATAGLRVAERVTSEKLGQQYTYAVRLVLYDRLLSMPSRAVGRRSQGGTALRFVGDLTAVRQWVSLGLARLVVAGTTIVASLAVLVVLSPVLALALTVVIAAGAAGALGAGGRLRAAARETRRRRVRLAGNINQQIGAVAVVHAFGQSDRERKRMKRQSRRLRDASISRARMSGLVQGGAEATAALATGTALVAGGLEVAAGRMQPATVVATMAVVGMLTAPLRDLGRVLEYRQNARISFEKLRGFIQTGPIDVTPPGAPPLVVSEGRLTFEGVTVDGSLDEIRAEAAPGSRVALVGPNGAGKSTLLEVAATLVRPDAGTVRIDGQDLAACSPESVHEAVAIAGPGVPLLRGTVGYNLRYRAPDAPDEQVDHVWDLCGITSLLASLPEGEKTRVAEDGAGLSSGQIQRIVLARALLGHPALLLLDEADSHLDPVTARVLDRVVSTFPGTVLMVTHRRERLNNVDAVWHVAGGRVVEMGPPDDLLDGDGPTARLFSRDRQAVA